MIRNAVIHLTGEQPLGAEPYQQLDHV